MIIILYFSFIFPRTDEAVVCCRVVSLSDC